MVKPHLKPLTSKRDEFFIINTKLVSLFLLLLLIIHFSETAEENCVEENHTEADHSDDSVRVKIADLGNACWVVSHVNWPGKQPLRPSSPSLLVCSRRSVYGNTQRDVSRINALQRFRYLSNSLRSSSLPTYSSHCLVAKSKTCTLGGTSLKEREIY